MAMKKAPMAMKKALKATQKTRKAPKRTPKATKKTLKAMKKTRKALGKDAFEEKEALEEALENAERGRLWKQKKQVNYGPNCYVGPKGGVWVKVGVLERHNQA